MNKKLALLGLLLCFALCSAKVTFKRSLVISKEASKGDETKEKNEIKKDFQAGVPKIYEMRVDTNVTNRYAKTLITSKVKNQNTKAKETTFSIVTPDKAFISGFTMEIGGKKYEAYVQGKEEAKQTYDQAVSSGQSAAHVAVSVRDSNRFTVSVNVEPESKVIFYLRYEELLSRKHEKYEIVLNIHPGQPVKDLDVQVNILESRPLKFVKVPSLRTGNEISKNKPNVDPEANIKVLNETSAVVTFKPDIIKQKLFATSLGSKEGDGLSGQFLVQYDVQRDPQGGEVLVDGGYFVHFFAPKDLPPINKQVVFILDTSGSMSGVRITQLKQAMNSILGELTPEDVFSIVEFNSAVSVWNVPAVKVSYVAQSYDQSNLDQDIPSSFEASADNIKNAKKVIQKIDADGSTSLQTGLKVGLQIVARNKDSKSHQPIIIFLTDGQPTDEYNTENIISLITELNVKKVPIFSLSFGDGADRAFLQKLSLKNEGFARHIYEAADASLQLEDFYKQICSPLLTDVSFKYVDNVQNVSRTHFPILFEGGELYITGVIAGYGYGGSSGMLLSGVSSPSFAPSRNFVTSSGLRFGFGGGQGGLAGQPLPAGYLAGRGYSGARGHGHRTYDSLSIMSVQLNLNSIDDDVDVEQPVQKVAAAISLAPFNIFSEIPWLKDALNENGTLTLESGTYSLGLNETVTLSPECQNSLNNTTGTCELLQECRQIHKELTDLVTYKKHFCEVQSFAAVCCPVSGTKAVKAH